MRFADLPPRAGVPRLTRTPTSISTAKRGSILVAIAALIPLAIAGARGGHDRAAPSGAGTPRNERLRYHATWNGLPVADAELLVQPLRDTVVLRARAETNEALDLLWKMRDSVEATVRLDPVRPQRFVLHQNENDRRRETTIVASPTRLVATVERRNRQPRRADVALTPSLHDPASVAYLIRSLPADLKGRTSYQVLAGTKIYAITVAPAGTERIEVADRTWRARRLHLTLKLTPIDAEATPAPGTAGTREPQAQVQDADLWLSAGAERLPLRMRAETIWGLAAIELDQS